MKKLLLYSAVCFMASVFLPSVGAEVKFLPLINADLMGGQSFYQGKTSSFGGHCTLDLVPALRLKDGVYLLPRYSGAYIGSSLTIEIEDEDYLYQQVMDHAFSLKFMGKNARGGVFKLSGGYMLEYLRETKNEKWSHGLYDYGSPYVEVELGKEFADKSLRLFSLGYRYYTMRFPNYESLASKLQLDLSGEDLMDTDNHKVFMSADIIIKREVFIRLGYDLLLSGYQDQKVALETGEYSNEMREDKTSVIKCNLGCDLPAKHLGSLSGGQTMNAYVDLELGLKIKRSGQNYFDADAVAFIAGYYDYNRFDVKPVLTYKFTPLGLAVSLGGRFSAKFYPNRPLQDKEGFFEEKKLRSKTYEANLAVTYDIGRGVSVSASGGYASVKSNTSYEKLYTYNYDSAYYIAGLSYEY